MMDLVEMPFMRFPAMPVVARVYAILAKYAVLGIAPVAVPPIVPDMTNPLEELPSQNGTDLAYIRELAYKCAYVFYVEPGPVPGSSIAYFGPDIRIPAPQPALNVNMDALTNVESLSFSLDGTAKKIVVITIMDPMTKKIPIQIPLPNISILRPRHGGAGPRRGREFCAQDAAHRQRFRHRQRLARRVALRAGTALADAGRRPRCGTRL